MKVINAAQKTFAIVLFFLCASLAAHAQITAIRAGKIVDPETRLSIETIDNWKEAGIPPLTILQALTTNAAKLPGVEKTRGFLKVAMRADIIAVGDNPLNKIETLKTVGFVMKNGKVFKQNSLVK